MLRSRSMSAVVTKRQHRDVKRVISVPPYVENDVRLCMLDDVRHVRRSLIYRAIVAMKPEDVEHAAIHHMEGTK